MVYGTTENGGGQNIGTVYAIGPGSVEEVLHTFRGGSNGSFPLSGLTNIATILRLYEPRRRPSLRRLFSIDAAGGLTSSILLAVALMMAHILRRRSRRLET